MNARTLPYLRLLFFINIGAVMFGVVHIIFSNNQTDDIYRQHLDDELRKVSKCRNPPTEQTNNIPSEYKVPNIVHYIWYNAEKVPFMFHHMLSVLSVVKIVKPDVIYFHTDLEPIGKYWEKTKQLPFFTIKYRKPPTTLFGETVKTPMYYTSHSNVDRVKILHEMGGIYLDLDTFVIRPFEELRKYPCVIAQEQESKACGSAILCSKGSHFLDLWLNAYLDDYRMEEWAYNSGQVPFNLAKRFPHLCHIETLLNKPNFKDIDQLWGPNTYDWKRNYAIHTYYRIWRDMSPYYIGEDANEENIKLMNNTFGAMARSIYYGSAELIPVDRLS